MPAWFRRITGFVFVGRSFVRITMMVHSANDRLDELESKIDKK